MLNQKRSQKKCECGRGWVYTGENATHNPVVDGKRVCQECFLDNIYRKALEDG